MDALTDVLKTVHLTGSLYYRSELSAPWGMSVPESAAAQFHVIRRGRCYLRQPNANVEPVLLESGDLVLLTFGQRHDLVDSLVTTPLPIADVICMAKKDTTDCHAPLCFGGGGEETTLICGYFAFESGNVHPLLSVLPPVIHIRGEGGRPLKWLEAILDLIAEEMGARQPGAETVMNRLIETMLIQLMRTYLAVNADMGASWLRGLRDPQIGQALGIIHRQPAETWTIDTLAASVGMSRSGFSERFRNLIGEPPMQYLTRWRMELAATHLRDGALSLGQIADKVGYRAEAAFSRVFKKLWGVSPGAYRRGEAAPLG